MKLVVTTVRKFDKRHLVPYLQELIKVWPWLDIDLLIRQGYMERVTEDFLDQKESSKAVTRVEIKR